MAAANAAARLDDPRDLWVLSDEDGWQAARRAPRSFDSFEDVPSAIGRLGGRIVTEPNLASLARATGIPQTTLERTLDSVNRQASDVPRTGLHVPFGRPPFHAVPLVPGITFTLGGIAVDAALQAVDIDGRLIPGLYAAGGTIGGLSGGPRGGYVGGLLPALVTGFIAGAAAAST